MAGISQKVSSDEVLPLLAREVFFLGYRGGTPTEFLILLNRYVSQARELSAVAGSSGVIRVSNCAEAEQLLHILGYRIREKCGERTASLFTADPERAFLTIDSGFPLTELEQTIQGGKPFAYEYSSTSVPVLFTESDWIAVKSIKKVDTKNLIDRLLRDPDLALLYWAFSRMDNDTVADLLVSPGLEKLLPYAALLNFYGSEICIRSGRVIVPGGPDAEDEWKDLAGAKSEAQGKFVLHLLEKDKGWLVAFFDALSRTSQAQQAHFTNVHRLKPLYVAFRPSDNSAGAAKGVFRPAPLLLLLLTRLQFDPDGEVHVPGNIETWKEVLRQAPNSKRITKWAKGKSNDPQQLLEAIFSFARASADSGPVQAFLSMGELDARRGPKHYLKPETVGLLASTFSQFSDQYLVFSEFPGLDDASITRFVHVVESVDKIHNHVLRGNAMGIFQADIGLWQILARQEQIPGTDLNQSWQKVVAPFSNINSPAVLFNAGRSSLQEVLRAATGEPNKSQDEILSLLAGPAQHNVEGKRVHAELADHM
ncbi:MAG: hypothetical protein ACRD2S_04380, partial [Terriglobales bacterium]